VTFDKDFTQLSSGGASLPNLGGPCAKIPVLATVWVNILSRKHGFINNLQHLPLHREICERQFTPLEAPEIAVGRAHKTDGTTWRERRLRQPPTDPLVVA
jgi:hypothetical protein